MNDKPAPATKVPAFKRASLPVSRLRDIGARAILQPEHSRRWRTTLGDATAGAIIISLLWMFLAMWQQQLCSRQMADAQGHAMAALASVIPTWDTRR